MNNKKKPKSESEEILKSKDSGTWTGGGVFVCLFLNKQAFLRLFKKYKKKTKLLKLNLRLFSM